MRAVRSQRVPRGPRRPVEPSRLRELDLRRRLQDAEDANAKLRTALGEVVAWYDTFDAKQPADVVDLTDTDFDRYRRLAKVFYRSRP